MRSDAAATLAAWLAATDIAVLELRGPGTALRLRRDAGGVRAEPRHDETPVEATVAVTAPCVGVFLHRHPLRGDDLAPAGTAVAAGQVLGLLQVGPLLHPVPSPVAGSVLETPVPHGDAVGYGTPLVILSDAARPDAALGGASPSHAP